MIDLRHGDCLEVLPTLPEGSVSLVCADLPYGVTANKWDTVIPLAPLWAQFLRVGKRNCAFIFTATQRFATSLINSQSKLFRYDLVWDKSVLTGFLDAKRKPLRQHEQILVFCKTSTVYNPQKSQGKRIVRQLKTTGGSNYNSTFADAKEKRIYTDRYPTSLLSIPNIRKKCGHPTQKPVALLDWLIRTYSNPGDLVLDPAMGSATAAVACINTGRRFIGIEKDAGYFAVCQKRVAEAGRQLCLPNA